MTTHRTVRIKPTPYTQPVDREDAKSIRRSLRLVEQWVKIRPLKDEQIGIYGALASGTRWKIVVTKSQWKDLMVNAIDIQIEPVKDNPVKDQIAPASKDNRVKTQTYLVKGNRVKTQTELVKGKPSGHITKFWAKPIYRKYLEYALENSLPIDVRWVKKKYRCEILKNVTEKSGKF